MHNPPLHSMLPEGSWELFTACSRAIHAWDIMCLVSGMPRLD